MLLCLSCLVTWKQHLPWHHTPQWCALQVFERLLKENEPCKTRRMWLNETSHLCQISNSLNSHKGNFKRTARTQGEVPYWQSLTSREESQKDLNSTTRQIYGLEAKPCLTDVTQVWMTYPLTGWMDYQMTIRTNLKKHFNVILTTHQAKHIYV